MSLHLAHSRADLPPRWDGEPVTWWPWSEQIQTSWRFHAPVEERACTECGVLDARTRSTAGLIDGVVRLQVTRCECGHDVVHDETTGEVWDLELEDYGPDGSRVEGSLW